MKSLATATADYLPDGLDAPEEITTISGVGVDTTVDISGVFRITHNATRPPLADVVAPLITASYGNPSDILWRASELPTPVPVFHSLREIRWPRQQVRFYFTDAAPRGFRQVRLQVLSGLFPVFPPNSEFAVLRKWAESKTGRYKNHSTVHATNQGAPIARPELHPTA